MTEQPAIYTPIEQTFTIELHYGFGGGTIHWSEKGNHILTKLPIALHIDRIGMVFVHMNRKWRTIGSANGYTACDFIEEIIPGDPYFNFEGPITE